jgi:uncharacterized protein (DUF488 family)
MHSPPPSAPETSRNTPARRKVAALYTIGYQGKTPEEFIALLLENGIEQLLDVRRDPISRKPGFSKRRLEEACAAAGLAYQHIPELGIASALRKTATTPEGHAQLLETYRAELLPAAQPFVAQAAALAAEHVTALMCFEADICCCHRGPLSETLSRLTKLPVTHL